VLERDVGQQREPERQSQTAPGAAEPDDRAPLIGLPLQLELVEGAPARLRQNRAYFAAIEHAGGIPLALPVPTLATTAPALLARCDGLVLPGGADVDPRRYGQEPDPRCSVVTVPEIDEAETAALRWAIEEDLPVLAICRGLQLANVALGGTLWQDLLAEGATTRSHQAQSRTELAHGLRIDPTSRLAAITGVDNVLVNTLHHQGLRELAAGLRPVGWSDDNLVEAAELERETLFLGLQCHPEELAPEHPWAARLFEALVADARRVARRRSAQERATP